jgi:signal transduction histidine kinase/ActR/RegA family two-component response regulator
MYGTFLLRPDLDVPARKRHELTQALDTRIREMSRDAPILKIKVYNVDGQAVYSSVLPEIGENKSQNSGFRNALEGRLVNELTHRGSMSATEGEIQNVDVVSTYIPIRLANNGKVVAVFELYSNVTDSVARIKEVTIQLLFALIGTFLALYLSLLAIVARADRILGRQYAALEENETRLLGKTAELETEINERHEIERALRHSEHAAASANRAKSDFLSGMSHELRTPMNSILGFAQLLETEPVTPLTERQQLFVKQIIKAGKHLLSLINQVLDLAKIEAGKLPISLEVVRVANVVDEALHMVQHLAEQMSVQPVNTRVGNLYVVADYGRLKQVILNLLSNAVKYNLPNGSISIQASDHGGVVKISVSDTGVGIEEEKQKELFQPFSRLGYEAGEIEGSGIGLALSKRLVESMSGKIGVESKKGQGSTFWITLPAAPPAPDSGEFSAASIDLPEGPQPDKRLSRRPRKRVLYVEDNPSNVFLMEEVVNRLPEVQLISAHTGELGIALAKQERPDLVIMDINLPGIDGLEALSVLRHDPLTAAIPVMALTANALASDIERGLAAGFDAYETKPIQITAFTQVLRDMLFGHHENV